MAAADCPIKKNTQQKKQKLMNNSINNRTIHFILAFSTLACLQISTTAFAPRVRYARARCVNGHPERHSADTKQMKTNQDEEAVDAYLEFLDRRYRRLHHDESDSAKKTKLSEQKSFSVWSWLKADSLQSQSPAESKQQQDDALYALGVAGLASKKLLQKHQRAVSPQQQAKVKPQTQSPIIAATDVVIVDEKKDTASPTSYASTFFLTKLFQREDEILQRIQGLRRALIALQHRQLVATLALAARFPTKLARRLWGLGGGRRNVIVTCSVVATLVVVVARPLLQMLLANETILA